MPSFNDRLEHRARLLERLFAALFLALGLASAWAQNFPSKPIRLIAPYPPGGFNDVTGRILAQQLAERFGQSVIVENKPGASTIIAAAAITKPLPGTYTLFTAGPRTSTRN